MLKHIYFAAAMGLTMALSSISDAQEHRVEVIAHRGASGYLPEHTCEAVAMAHAMGADWIEQDVVLTSDGVPVVLHDIHLDTVTDVAKKFPTRKRDDGRYYAIDFTLEEVKQLQVSERFNPRTGKAVFESRFPAHSGDFEVPTLEEEIILIQGLNHSTGRNAGIYPELKHPKFHHDQGQDLAQVVLATLKKYGYQHRDDRAIVQCFEWDEVVRLRSEMKTDLTLIYLSNGKDLAKLAATSPDELHNELTRISKIADGIGPTITSLFSIDENGEILPSRIVSSAHQVGLVVHPWTIRKDEISKPFKSFDQMHEMIRSARIDGVFSDFPDASRERFDK